MRAAMPSHPAPPVVPLHGFDHNQLERLLSAASFVMVPSLPALPCCPLQTMCVPMVAVPGLQTTLVPLRSSNFPTR